MLNMTTANIFKGGIEMDSYRLCLAVFFALVFCLFFGINLLEKRYRFRHPPDNWDGMREEKFDDENDGTSR